MIGGELLALMIGLFLAWGLIEWALEARYRATHPYWRAEP